MDAVNFVYWLQGFMEIGNPKKMTEEQVQVIKDHLALVLKKETPKRLEAFVTDYPKAVDAYMTNFQHQASC